MTNGMLTGWHPSLNDKRDAHRLASRFEVKEWMSTGWHPELRDISDDVECAWAIIGDSNLIMIMEEREGGLSFPFIRGMIQFNNFVQDCKLIDSIPRGNKHKRPFRFKVAWLRHDDYSNHIYRCWRDTEILTQEELMWFQKSRSKGLAYRHMNTKYFYGTNLIKRKKNTYESLQIKDGTWVTN
ncbi:hypothetical protein CR513_48668, partial [Mucuna pruriens]